MLDTTTTLTDIGSTIKDLREIRGWTQRQLAERWGVSHTTIQRECRREEVRGLYRDAIRQVGCEQMEAA